MFKIIENAHNPSNNPSKRRNSSLNYHQITEIIWKSMKLLFYRIYGVYGVNFYLISVFEMDFSYRHNQIVIEEI